jgi:hypothetical protein
MSAPTKSVAPAAYEPLEYALRLLEAGSAAGALVAKRLDEVDHPAAERAAALLRLGRWR